MCTRRWTLVFGSMCPHFCHHGVRGERLAGGGASGLKVEPDITMISSTSKSSYSAANGCEVRCAPTFFFIDKTLDQHISNSSIAKQGKNTKQGKNNNTDMAALTDPDATWHIHLRILSHLTCYDIFAFRRVCAAYYGLCKKAHAVRWSHEEHERKRHFIQGVLNKKTYSLRHIDRFCHLIPAEVAMAHHLEYVQCIRKWGKMQFDAFARGKRFALYNNDLFEDGTVTSWAQTNFMMWFVNSGHYKTYIRHKKRLETSASPCTMTTCSSPGHRGTF
jgi:hypothetical protein